MKAGKLNAQLFSGHLHGECPPRCVVAGVGERGLAARNTCPELLGVECDEHNVRKLSSTGSTHHVGDCEK